MSREYKIHNPEGIYFITPTVVAWIDVFTRLQYKEIVIESLKYCQSAKGLKIYAYVIMTNHLHLIVQAEKGNLSEIIRDFKKFTSKQILKSISENIQESRKKWMLNIFEFAGKNNSNNSKFQFWQQHNSPVELYSNEVIEQKINYIHQNPVRNGIVEREEEYLYSSARNYAELSSFINIEKL